MLTKERIKILIQHDPSFLDYAAHIVYKNLNASVSVSSIVFFCQQIYTKNGKIPAIKALREQAKQNQDWIARVCEDVGEDVKYNEKDGPYIGLLAAKLFVEKHCS